MRAAILAVAMLAFAAPAAAQSGEESLWTWTKLDTATQATALSLIAVDWMQTVTFTQHMPQSDRNYEANRILGKHPSRAKLNTLIPLGMVGHTVLVVASPKPIRQVLQALVIYLEVDAVRSNCRAGVTLTLPWK